MTKCSPDALGTHEAELAYLLRECCSSLSLFLVCGSSRTACGAASAGALLATFLVSLELHISTQFVEAHNTCCLLPEVSDRSVYQCRTRKVTDVHFYIGSCNLTLVVGAASTSITCVEAACACDTKMASVHLATEAFWLSHR